MGNQHVLFNVVERSYAAIIKKEIHALALQCSFTANELAEIDIIVAELVSNLLKYAKEGRLLVKVLAEPKEKGLEIISLDSGPGISDVNHMLEDGNSTGNSSMGAGLGAIKRLSHFFEIYSQRNWGTVMVMRKFSLGLTELARKPKVTIRSVIVAKPGEQECGDGMYLKQSPQLIKLLLGDGLGHGKHAATAIGEAIKVFKDSIEENTVDILRGMHSASTVRKTRGLVATAAILHLKTATLKLCGIGNISSRMLHRGNTKNFLSYNGIVGLNIPSVMNEQVQPLEKGQLLVLCSDGIKTRWDLARHPSIGKYDPAIIATAIYKDFCRNTDDTSVVVVRVN